jgi:hypothetical protein
VEAGMSGTFKAGWQAGNLGRHGIAALSVNSAEQQTGSRQGFCAVAWRRVLSLGILRVCS